MIVKDILKLFFRYPLKAFPVLSESGDTLQGILRKDRAVELSASSDDLDLELQAGGIDPVDRKTVQLVFGAPGAGEIIPLLNIKGEVERLTGKEELLALLTPPVPPPEPAPAPVPEPVPQERESLLLLNSIPMPVIVINPGRNILFANKDFSHCFMIEREFLLNQDIRTFFPKLKIDSGYNGTFTYQHRKWRYKVNFEVDRIFIIFNEVRASQTYGFAQEVDKLLRGKTDLKDLMNQYEQNLIRRFMKKSGMKSRATAQALGITEQELQYRLNKKKPVKRV